MGVISKEHINDGDRKKWRRSLIRRYSLEMHLEHEMMQSIREARKGALASLDDYEQEFVFTLGWALLSPTPRDK